MVSVTVLIATSMGRTNWLINRSLYSVYKQINIDAESIEILIVDDNKNIDEFFEIKKQVKNLRIFLGIKDSCFKTKVIRNRRTKFNSGTGAWNTGLEEIIKSNKDSYVSILDDDDFYLKEHLISCIKLVKKNTLAVFQSLVWINEDGSKIKFPLNKNKITPTEFFMGNPGIQGSNMFFKVSELVKIGGFDENLPNTTDRDLMIRFLNNLSDNKAVEIEKKVGVLHYNHDKEKVNNKLDVKKKGLDMFYQKHKNEFSELEFRVSLERAKQFFNYVYC